MLLSFFFIMARSYSQEVHYNYERSARFFVYRTYQWVETPSAQKVDPPDAQLSQSGLQHSPSGAPDFPATASDVSRTRPEDQLIDAEIKRAVDEQLAQRGLTRVEKNGDLQVVYHAAIRQEVSMNLFSSGWGARGYSTLWNGPVLGQSSNIPVGTLVIDLYDPARGQLIWRGDAIKTIDFRKKPSKNYKNVQKAMAKLFDNYPPLQGE